MNVASSCRGGFGLALAIALTAPLCAQGDARNRPIGSRTVTGLESRSMELERHTSELRDLIERHGRGEDISRSRWLDLEDARATQTEDAQRNLQHSEGDARALREELARLRALREERRRTAERLGAGDTLPRAEELDRAPRPGSPEARSATPVAPTPAPVVDSAAARVGDGEATRVLGSSDHRRVAHALLRAGIELRGGVAKLGAEGRVAAAAAQETAARARLESARAEFRTLVLSGDATLEDRFSLARCEEALGELDVAESLYTDVMARDLHPQPDGSTRYGVFGRSAATARSVLAWSKESGDWRPRKNVDEIVLDGR